MDRSAESGSGATSAARSIRAPSPNETVGTEVSVEVADRRKIIRAATVNTARHIEGGVLSFAMAEMSVFGAHVALRDARAWWAGHSKLHAKCIFKQTQPTVCPPGVPLWAVVCKLTGNTKPISEFVQIRSIEDTQLHLSLSTFNASRVVSPVVG